MGLRENAIKAWENDQPTSIDLYDLYGCYNRVRENLGVAPGNMISINNANQTMKCDGIMFQINMGTVNVKLKCNICKDYYWKRLSSVFDDKILIKLGELLLKPDCLFCSNKS